MRNDLLALIDSKGRLDYNRFRTYLSRRSEQRFIEEARHPLLLGKELYEGILEQDPYNRTNTLPFTVKEFQNILETPAIRFGAEPEQEDDESSFSRAIFLLHKKNNSQGLANEINIGRLISNDVVTADYSVSKQHATLVIFYNRYYVIDHNSTNLTQINDEPVAPGKKVPLPIDSDIAFGRLVFRFIAPERLYQLMQDHDDARIRY